MVDSPLLYFNQTESDNRNADIMVPSIYSAEVPDSF